MSSGPLTGSSDPRPANGPTEAQLPESGPSGSGTGELRAAEVELPRDLGPYRLERLLGSGGMGEVYQAYDRRLQRRVAIKHFRPGDAAGAGTASRERFLREARAAASLSHPSIVHIHDILEDEEGDWEGDWIVMERVDGPTVAQLVAQGPLPVERAITIARQVVEGLAAAHKQGILHRDLKSENVMLGRDGRAKILDFGLAKRLWPGDVEVSLSLEGRVLGTCRTMSPEQARGRELDARSDLFALGVLLYEMLTGDSPFQQDTHVDTLARVCHHHPPPVAQVNPQVPDELSALVQRLLQKQRELRPSEAGEVAEILAEMDATMSQSGSAVRTTHSGSPVRSGSVSASERGSGQGIDSPTCGDTLLAVPTPSSSPAAPSVPESPEPSPPSTGPSRWSLASLGLDSPYRPSLRRRAVVAAAVGLAAILGFVAWSFRAVIAPVEAPGVAEATPAIRPSIAVLGFKNLSRDEGVAWISTGLAEMLNAELAASPGLRTVAGETVARAKRELALGEGETLGAATLSKIRLILGADKVVVGSYLAVPGADDLRLVVTVQDTLAGTTETTLSETASQPEILDLVTRVGERVRRELGSGPLSADDSRAARATRPESPEALELYSEGLRQMRAFELVRARDLFQKAVDAEPEFPLAHAALAEAWSALGYDKKAQDAAARAVELAGELSREDRLFVEARDHEMSWRWDQAIESYRTLWEFFPDNVEYGLRLAGALTSAGHGREALEVVASMRELPAPASEDVRIDLAEAEALRWLSDYRRALTVARRAVEHSAKQGARLLEAEARFREAIALLHLEEPGRAAPAIHAARKLFAEAGDVRGEALTSSRLADLVSYAGDFSRALRIRADTLTLLRKLGDKQEIAKTLHNLAWEHLEAGQLSKAGSYMDEASKVAREIGDRRLEGAFRSTHARLAQQRGELATAGEDARASLKAARDFDFDYAAMLAQWALGQVDLAQSDFEGARAVLAEALKAARSSGDRVVVVRLLTALGDLESAAADSSKSRAYYREALRTAERLDSRGLAVPSRLGLALLDLRRDRPAAALKVGQEILATPYELGAGTEARALSLIAIALLRLDRIEEVRTTLVRLDKVLARCESVPARLEVRIQTARCRAALGDSTEAKRDLEAARKEAAGRGFKRLEIEASRVLSDLG